MKCRSASGDFKLTGVMVHVDRNVGGGVTFSCWFGGDHGGINGCTPTRTIAFTKPQALLLIEHIRKEIGGSNPDE